jgi:hypothetical protein
MRGADTNPKAVVGAILILIGVVAFAYQGVAHAPCGPLPPILGALAVVSGLAVLFVATESAYRGPTPTR